MEVAIVTNENRQMLGSHSIANSLLGFPTVTHLQSVRNCTVRTDEVVLQGTQVY